MSAAGTLNTLIECRGVSFAYEGSPAVTGLDFSVSDGDYLCVVGENGSGKSTLMKGLLRLKTPSAGTLKFSEGLRRSEIGYMPQQTAAQRDFPASVFEVVLSGRQASRGLRPFYSKKDVQIAHGNMRMLGVDALIGRCYRELSGGQQQRALLARALTAASKLLILDEPVAGLDPVASVEMYEAVDRVRRELGLTVVMVSHDIGAALKYAGLVLHLRGRQLFFGTAEEYRASDASKGFI
jgi:zinc transport system ATP-binding protein